MVVEGVAVQVEAAVRTMLQSERAVQLPQNDNKCSFTTKMQSACSFVGLRGGQYHMIRPFLVAEHPKTRAS